jgi:mediator of RNA polymerase II transcription subunit 7
VADKCASIPFSQLSATLPSLKEQGIEQLFPSPAPADTSKDSPSPPFNHAYYLLKISKSLLLNFLEFVGVLSVSPAQFEGKLEDLRNLFVNAHHLLNIYRPHQARESLIMMMEEQLERSREELREMQRVKEKVKGLLEQLEADGLGTDGGAGQAVGEGSARKKLQLDNQAVEEAKRMWDLLEETEKH